MYKFLVSCYYWPAAERLRLRSLQIRTNQRRQGTGLDYSEAERVSVEKTPISSERRRAQRFVAECEAELTASLALLDSDAHPCSDTLLFFGRTRDLSAGGLALILPSMLVDERYCGEWARLHLLLHLPTGAVSLEVNPVRWQLVQRVGTPLGYLMGAQILSIDDHRDEYDNYLRSISDLTLN
jgi:hypothetical protein